jgi:hypothetical protein
MSNRPQDNAFQQQKLKAWQPLLTPQWVIGTFLSVGILFLIIGPIILSASDGIFEHEIPYESVNFCGWEKNCSLEPPAVLSYTFTESVKPPLYVYYKLENFYQNHRRYVKSRSDDQLSDASNPDLSSCDPLQTWEVGDEEKNLYPCGLIANSFFNDSIVGEFTKSGENTVELAWNEEDIAWPSDHDKFKRREAKEDETRTGPGGFVLPDVDDPHFMVWMRTAGLPTFKKLYAIIEEDQVSSFEEGDNLTVVVGNVFPVESFKGKKYIVFSTTSWLGGKNTFLAYAYIVVGVVCLFLAFAFFIRHQFFNRKLGSMEYFNFPEKKLSEGGQ